EGAVERGSGDGGGRFRRRGARAGGATGRAVRGFAARRGRGDRDDLCRGTRLRGRSGRVPRLRLRPRARGRIRRDGPRPVRQCDGNAERSGTPGCTGTPDGRERGSRTVRTAAGNHADGLRPPWGQPRGSDRGCPGRGRRPAGGGRGSRNRGSAHQGASGDEPARRGLSPDGGRTPVGGYSAGVGAGAVPGRWPLAGSAPDAGSPSCPGRRSRAV
ncbi:MAG: hypothetical protein AVDCRST_MAG59-4487, partial [uncultured Thermomicrobiales bacterium]